MTGLAAIVLAGGASRRMGRDKALLTWQGQTLVQRTVQVVGARCAPVFVLKRPGQRLEVSGAVLLDDAEPGEGPLPALGQGLRAAAEAGVGWAFACAVDMPLLDARIIDELLADGGADVVVPHAGGRDHYLAARYRTGLWPQVCDITGRGVRRLQDLVESVRVQRVSLTDPAWVTNVNSTEDLRRLTDLP